MQGDRSELTRLIGWWWGGAVVATAVVVVWRRALFTRAPIVSGDLFVPFTREGLLAQYVPFWNPILEFPNVETIDRLAFVAPFLLLGDPAAVQAGMIAVLVIGAGLSMFLSSRWLGAPWLPAVLAGVAYACNPWIANRLQHLFLLPGYVALPAIVALAIRPPRRNGVLALVLLLTIGSSTPHTTLALWATLAGLTLLRPTRRLGLFAWTAVAYTAVNVWWWLPTGVFLLDSQLVPSWPTVEQLALFSRNADLASVLRLEGYWWPLTAVPMTRWAGIAGLGLAAAALLGAARASPALRRERALMLLLALALAVMALGTRGPGIFAPLVLETPAADRIGWLLRDPNKLLGAVAAFMLLLAAGVGPVLPRDRRAAVGTTLRSALLGAFLAFSIPHVSSYVDGAYASHPPPEGIEQAAEWLDARGGRTAWVPAYFGAQTFWNGDQLTPEVLSQGSPVPVLSPYGYDERARRAFLTLDFGAVLGDVQADAGTLMHRWGVRWLAHHRDVLPSRMQPPHAFDPRVELRALRLPALGVPVAAELPGVTIYGRSRSEGAPDPVPLQGTAWFTLRPEAAAAALSTFGERALDHVVVQADHEGLAGVLALPGDAFTLALAPTATRVDLASGTSRSAVGEAWSRLAETDLAWWPRLAARGGMPPADAAAVVVTSRPGAELHTDAEVASAPHDVWVRAYLGPRAGAVRVELLDADVEWTLDLEAVSPSMAWIQAGSFTPSGERERVRLVNIEGENAIGGMQLVSHDASSRAHERLAAVDLGWLWTPPSSCRTSEAEEEPELSVSSAVPWSGQIPATRAWRDYASVELALEGHGDGRTIEVWTLADETWVLLGSVDVWWRGIRTTYLTVDADVFFAARRGAGAPAEFLRVLERSRLDSAGGDGGRLRLERIRLRSGEECAWAVDAPRDATYLLQASGGGESVELDIGGRPVTLAPGSTAELALTPGRHVIRFPSGVSSGTAALWLGTRRLTPAEDVPQPASKGLECPDAWRLNVTHDRYVDRLEGRIDGRSVEAVPVDGLVAGYWLPPGVCGSVEPHNPWSHLGGASLMLSLGALALLLAISFRGRVP